MPLSQQLVERAKELLKTRRCSCLYVGLAQAKVEYEENHCVELTRALAHAYAVVDAMRGAKSEPSSREAANGT